MVVERERGREMGVRRADSLPAVRAIDCEKAARWVKTNCERRMARARMEDMMIYRSFPALKKLVCVCGVVFAGFRVSKLVGG